MKVLVTGGTGFIGSSLLRHLLAANYEVRILARHKKNRFLIEGLDVEIFDGDITNPEAVDKAVKGCGVVFDLASIYTFYPFWEREAKALYKINVQGTINMLNAALKNRVQRFIHTSTIATIGKRPDGKPSDETTPLDFENAIHYARSKYLAEREVLNYCRKGLPAIILNPGIAIGERDYKPTPSGEIIVNFLNRRYPGYFDTTWAVADVDDVARAHISAIDHGRIGERYILCDKKHYTLREVFNLLEKISGVKAPRIKIPYSFLYPFVYSDELFSYFVFKKRPAMPTEGVKFCRMSPVCDNSKAIKELDYAATPFEETLSKAVSWYRKNGYVEPRGFFRIKAHGSKKVKFIMQKLYMHKYADTLSLDSFVFYLVVRALQFLQKIGLKPSDDGWRKTTQTYLRAEHSKFLLTAFRLDFRPNPQADHAKTFDSAKECLTERLAQFIKQHPALHWRLIWHRFSAVREGTKYSDIVQAEFAENGNLKTLKCNFDDAAENDLRGINAELTNILIKGIIENYNKTRNVADKKRPLALKRKLDSWRLRQAKISGETQREQAGHFIDRVLSATFIQFEVLPEDASGIDERRFKSPCFIKAKHPGFGFLNILCRFTYGLKEADLWVQYSHIPDDGVPMQEILDTLKRQWGRCGVLKLTAPDNENRAIPELCSSEGGKRGIYQVREFIDFQHFMRMRRKLNKSYLPRLKGNITVAALFIWRMSQYGVFENIKFAVPVDLRSTANRQRTLGFVFIRPSVYFDKDRPDKGFIRFQQEFNRQLKATVRRRSESYKLLERYALVPPSLYAASLRLLKPGLNEFVGTIGVTIIKKADLFIGPFSDVHTDGFIAISNLLIPAQDDSRVCSVSIKGPRHKITAYLDAIREIAGSES